MKKLLVLLSLLSCSVLFAIDVKAVNGKVEVLKDGEWIQLNVGDTLKEKDTIQTGFRSSVTLDINNSIVELSQLTRLTLDKISDENVNLFAKSGSVKSNVNNNGRRLGFTVRTPIATASVRGTEFSVANTFRGTDINTTRGVVAAWSNNGSDNVEAPRNAVEVRQNQATQVETSGNTVAPVEVARNEAININSGTASLANIPTVLPTTEVTTNESASLSISVSWD